MDGGNPRTLVPEPQRARPCPNVWRTVGKRGPRAQAGAVIDFHPEPATPPERPPIPWDRIVLEEPDAARLLKLGRSTFRAKAAAGEFPRYAVTGGTYRYYAYDLIDWLIARRQEG